MRLSPIAFPEMRRRPASFTRRLNAHRFAEVRLDTNSPESSVVSGCARSGHRISQSERIVQHRGARSDVGTPRRHQVFTVCLAPLSRHLLASRGTQPRYDSTQWSCEFTPGT